MILPGTLVNSSNEISDNVILWTKFISEAHITIENSKDTYSGNIGTGFVTLLINGWELYEIWFEIDNKGGLVVIL